MNLINLMSKGIVIGAWWNPWSWGDEIANAIEAMSLSINSWLVGATTWE